MKRISLISLVAVLSLTAAFAQKPALDHSVYDDWKSLGRISIPDCGDWATFTVSPQEGDAVLHLYNIRTGKEYRLDCVSSAVISQDATRAVFKISPEFKKTRQAKIDKKKGDDMPQASLGVINLATGKIDTIARVKDFKHSAKLGSYVAFTKAAEPKGKPKKGEKPEAKSTDRYLYVLNIKTMALDSIKAADTYQFTKSGDRFAYITKPGDKDSTTVRGIFIYNPATKASAEVLTGDKKAFFSGSYFDKKGDRLAFYAKLDTAGNASKTPDLYIYSAGKAEKVIAGDSKSLQKNWRICSSAPVEFHDNYFTFGTQPIPKEKDTTLVDFEQARLDIWVWNEDYIQPVQKVRVGEMKNRSYLARAQYDGTCFAQLADEEIPSIMIGEKNTQDFILAECNKPYRVRNQWDTDPCSDIYQINLLDGSRRLLETAAPYERFSSSPNGAYYVAFNTDDNCWYMMEAATCKKTNLTEKLGVIFYDDENDRPEKPGSNGYCVWSEDNRFFWIRDKYDFWQFDPTGAKEPFKVTDGRNAGITYNYQGTAYHESGKSVMSGSREVKTGKPAWFTTFNHKSKKTGVARLDLLRKGAKAENLAEGPYTYGNLAVGIGKKTVVVFDKGNFEEGNNLFITRDAFKTQQKLTDINPQQKNYNWGTVELVSWNASDGTPAEGLLYKPENFDASKKYPVMIYFYERNSDNLYMVRNPAPSASTVNIPYFVSNEYLVFVPDIRYKDGHPGKSALNFIMPGCDMLCKYPWVDGDNMAIQGQSWGGYQVAYMITQTNRFKAAGAGAPVSNMTSAYGGIRWESGLARTMQYEKGQSRIGKDLWEGFDLYYENSPLFFVPNVTTPVLIMHNDADGAVPWWQGIEFFNGLRRCGKQAWLLQYNDEAHNLRERRNRKDLSRRLEQFFDHFLKGKPTPVWMAKGVPATEKGISYGFEYVENE